MLTYYKDRYNDYTIRTAAISSEATHLALTIQDMTTLENHGVMFNPGQWSYSEYESFVSFSVNLDTTTNDMPVGNEFRATLTPWVTGSGYFEPVWDGSFQFFTSQSIDKPAYVNQIPVEDNGEYPYKSHTSQNQYIILT